MKLLNSILFFFFFCLVFGQNNLDKLNEKDFSILKHSFVFKKNEISCFENKLGNLKETNNTDVLKVPFVDEKAEKVIENDKISFLLLNNYLYLNFIDLEKSNLIIKYKNKFDISSKTTREDFKRIFPLSYNSPSYIPGTPPENAVGYTVIINNKKGKAYLNFSFYYNRLASIMISDKYSEITY